MRFILLAMAVLLLPALAGAGVPEPAPMKCLDHSPLLGKSDSDWPPPPQGDRGFDVLSYDLDLILDPSRKTITGMNAVRLRALEGDLDRVRLDLVDELAVTAVTTDRIALSFTHAGDSLVIDLPAPVPAGQIAVFTISWEGVPPPHGPFRTGLMFREHEAGTLNDRSDDVPIIANMSQPWSSHAWWPCKDSPGDKALVSMTATVPDTLVAVSNGMLLQTTDSGDGWTSYRYGSEYPIAPYLVSVAASNYRGWGEFCNVPGNLAVLLRFYVFPQHETNARYDLGRTCEMMDFMAGIAGPYPFAREPYTQAEFKWFGSMEHQTASSLSQIIFTGDRYHEGTVIHELAHQWYGDSLTPAQWSDIWLNEGFARYIEALWVEHTEGREAYEEYMRRIGIQRYPHLWQGDGTLGDPHPILPNAVIYDKGAWVLHMLRMKIGDDAFFAFTEAYAGDPNLALGSVTLADMIAHAEAAAAEDLGPFFDPWIWTETIPVVESTVPSIR
jgi:aminopeptidase N